MTQLVRIAYAARLLVAVALLSACVAPAAPKSTSPAARASLQPSDVASPAAAATGRVGLELESHPLGPLRGEWSFVLRRLDAPNRNEIWAIPMDGGDPKLVAKFTLYRPAKNDTVGAISYDLARHLSPDGKTLLLVVSVSAQHGPESAVVALALETGRASVVAADIDFVELEAAWSPDGGRIALSRRPTSAADLPRKVWTMRPDGTDLRPVRGAGRDVGTLYGYTPDGKMICVGGDYSYDCLEPSSGALSSFEDVVVDTNSIPADWRPKAPSFVALFLGPEGAHLDVADALGGARRIIARDRAFEPRWRPGADEVLYISDNRGIRLATVPASTPRAVGTSKLVRRAAWARQGKAIAYIGMDAASAAQPVTSLRLIPLDGAAERELFRPTGDERGLGLSELVVFTYR